MTFSPYQNSLIDRVFDICHGNCAAVHRYLKKEYNWLVDPSTIRRKCKANGRKLNPRGGKRIALNGGRGALTDEEISEVIALKSVYDSINQAAKNSPYGYGTIWNHFKKHELSITESSEQSIDAVINN